MDNQRGIGVILICVGTCALTTFLFLVEICRFLQGSLANYTFIFTYFPLQLCLAVPIIWICIGLVLVIRGKNRPRK